MQAHFVSTAELTRIPTAVVVVDVMRAFTAAAWAFAQGADRIVLAETLDQARALKSRHPDWVALKDGPPAPGFDTVNSPGKLRSLDLSGRTLVQKTLNGTTGAQAARHAPLLMCASFTVAAATARLLRHRDTTEATFVITGDGGLADEDLACAQYIAELTRDPNADPAPYLHRAAASTAAEDLADGLRHGYQGIHAEDIALCLEANRFPFAMTATLDGPLMTLRSCPTQTG
ncbi:2-phosphosulfolactate phosphatase [Streptomyces antioxidans]|uniref:Probable 2-phosphosulfolactate phosphatase n=1 Tax=Streptomyces antioxidans TaxID=1507734 RepID=A0A1V4D8M1_9ACTN|nr:2-phosphosulfolactate phosphatase [Streptomyces antioxidans]OPF81409.1 2-phosphosulfolactate phosphatase [Streptomyces antioxidans]